MNFAHPHFAEPRWLWLAVLGPLAVLLLHRYAAWARNRQLGLFAAPELIANLVRSHSPARRALQIDFRAIVFAQRQLAGFFQHHE